MDQLSWSHFCSFRYALEFLHSAIVKKQEADAQLWHAIDNADKGSFESDILLLAIDTCDSADILIRTNDVPSFHTLPFHTLFEIMRSQSTTTSIIWDMFKSVKQSGT